MKTITDFPYDVLEEEHVWIPVSDGIKLSAKIWRPKGSDDAPVPAILEYIPYYKRFGTNDRDAMTNNYLAGHGYACIRLDIRGSGESEGVLTDEYLESELRDGVEAIEWLAQQKWCDGNVGMMGISWGGFNGLQIAALRPEPLKAIVTIASTDDRYADDIHHMGGTLLADNLSWASVMFSYNTMPPDPAIVGDRWREMWKERLEGSGLWLKTWLHHQRRDEYWQHGSVCEDYSDINIPVFAVSGWTDGYTNSVFRLMENLDVPRKGLVGPWAHAYPHIATPGPAIDFLGELLRWWDKWLKGADNGAEQEPMIQAWMQESAPPRTSYDHRPGRWVTEKSWPAAPVEDHSYTLAPDGHLEDQKHDDVAICGIDVQSPVSVGLHGGKWCSYTYGPDLAGDQRLDDGGSLVFETAPLEEPLEILGAPSVELLLSSDKPVAMVAVRLSDVRPDHQVTRVTYGLLNLTHRDSAEHPEALEPGKQYRVRVPLNYIAQQFPAGHRIRLSISTTYWPIAWTPPENTQLRIWTGESKLILPHRAPQDSDNAFKGFGEPVGAAFDDITIIQPEDHTWTIRHSLDKGTTEVIVVDDWGTFKVDDIDISVGLRAEERYTAQSDDPASVWGEVDATRSLQRGDWNIYTKTHTRLSSDKDNFYITAELDAYEGDNHVIHKSWNETIKRDLV